jgi:hypothetical protein
MKTFCSIQSANPRRIFRADGQPMSRSGTMKSIHGFEAAPYLAKRGVEGEQIPVCR